MLPLSTDNPDNVLVLYASYYNDTFIQTSASREVNGYAIKDAEMTVALTTPHLINSKATWRPSILKDIEVRCCLLPWRRRFDWMFFRCGMFPGYKLSVSACACCMVDASVCFKFESLGVI